jgi:hypothetical protein
MALYRVLTLDGGGAKGFYTLGVLREIEGLVGARLYGKFDLIFGTSTGAIIAAALALGYSVEEIHDLYKKHVVSVMALKSPGQKTARLQALAKEIFGERKFDDVKTGIGIVATKWLSDRPMVFKASKEQAHGRLGTFKPGPGAPTLTSSFRGASSTKVTVAKGPGHRGEREVSRKPPRRESRRCSGSPVVLPRCFLLHGAHGCDRHPTFPAP